MSGEGAKCRRCGERILWCLSESGKRLPVDARPSPRGVLVLFTDHAGNLNAWHQANREPDGPDRYVCHLDTCKAGA